MTPEQLREWAEHKTCRPSGSVYSCPCLLAGTVALSDQLRDHAAALEELARVRAERDAAEYKALHREEMFNQRASLVRDLQRDAMNAEARAERAESALAEAERKIGRLKFHAEAMADALSAWVEIEVKEVAAYRAEFKEG